MSNCIENGSTPVIANKSARADSFAAIEAAIPVTRTRTGDQPFRKPSPKATPPGAKASASRKETKGSTSAAVKTPATNTAITPHFNPCRTINTRIGSGHISIATVPRRGT